MGRSMVYFSEENEGLFFLRRGRDVRMGPRSEPMHGEQTAGFIVELLAIFLGAAGG